MDEEGPQNSLDLQSRRIGVEDLDACEVFMNRLFEGYTVRVATIEGQLAYAAVDVAKVLEIKSSHVMMRKVDDNWKGRCSVPTLGGTQSVAVVMLPGVLQLITSRRVSKGSALSDRLRKFSMWVMEAVVPKAMADVVTAQSPPAFKVPTTLAEALRFAADVEEQRVLAENRADQEAALAEAERMRRALAEAERNDAREGRELAEVEMDALEAVLRGAPGAMSVAAAAKVMSNSPDIQIGQRRLFAFMRELKWIRNEPVGYRGSSEPVAYQRAIDAGWISMGPMLSRVHPVTGAEIACAPRVQVSPKGLRRLVKLWLERD